MMTASASLSGSTPLWAVKRSALTSADSVSLGTSSMKLLPAVMFATRRGSRSTPSTVAPDSAKATASGSPT